MPPNKCCQHLSDQLDCYSNDNTIWYKVFGVLYGPQTEKAKATHSSTLTWKIPWTEEPGGLHTVHGVAKSRVWLSNFTFTFHFHALEREMAAHSSVLAWRVPGTEEPGGLPSMGSHRVGHGWSDLAAAAAAWTLDAEYFINHKGKQEILCLERYYHL